MNNILYVNVIGGPPFEYVISRLQELGKIYVLQPEAMSNEEERQLRTLVENVIIVPRLQSGSSFQSLLMDFALKIEATILLTFDEFYLRDVSVVAEQIGLRGAGSKVFRSVNKVDMYQTLEQFDLLKRFYVSAPSIEQILSASIPTPFVVKPSECAGSLGVFAIRTNSEISLLPERLRQAEQSVKQVVNTMPSNESLTNQAFLCEEMLIGDANAWFGDETPFADYVSVEGMVLNGRYHPLAITQNLPLIDPFIETVSLTPTTLPMSLQLKIIDRLRPCIESFGLGTCGVHTEVKLLKNQEFAVIETAARFAGWCIIPQISSVFDIDPVRELVLNLLDGSHTFDLSFEQIFERKIGASATINLLPVSESGQSWEPVVFQHEPNLTSVINATSNAVFTPYISLGDIIEPISIFDGAWNSFGKIFIQARDVATLCVDICNIRSHLRDLIS